MSWRSDFENDIRRIREDSRQDFYGILLDLYDRIRTRTPVLNGIAVGNWRCSIGSPDNTFDPSDADPSKTKNADRAELTFGNIAFGDTAFISNSTPYIGFLEDGHSPQAPEGMVEISVQEVKIKYRIP